MPALPTILSQRTAKPAWRALFVAAVCLAGAVLGELWLLVTGNTQPQLPQRPAIVLIFHPVGISSNQLDAAKSSARTLVDQAFAADPTLAPTFAVFSTTSPTSATDAATSSLPVASAAIDSVSPGEPKPAAAVESARRILQSTAGRRIAVVVAPFGSADPAFDPDFGSGVDLIRIDPTAADTTAKSAADVTALLRRTDLPFRGNTASTLQLGFWLGLLTGACGVGWTATSAAGSIFQTRYVLLMAGCVVAGIALGALAGAIVPASGAIVDGHGVIGVMVRCALATLAGGGLGLATAPGSTTPPATVAVTPPTKLPNRLVTNGRTIDLFDQQTLRGPDVGLPVGGPIARVNRHPTIANVFGLRNESTQPWQVTLPDGSTRQVAPGQSVKLQSGTTIRAGGSVVRIV